VVHYFYQSSCPSLRSIPRQQSGIISAGETHQTIDVMWGLRQASFWWGLFHYYFLETTTILFAILFYSTNQQLQLHFTNQLYTTIPNNTPHNTAIMPRQFFVGGNFKM
jgi:hypothetical protein